MQSGVIITIPLVDRLNTLDQGQTQQGDWTMST
jgi:hypothetical protein